MSFRQGPPPGSPGFQSVGSLQDRDVSGHNSPRPLSNLAHKARAHPPPNLQHHSTPTPMHTLCSTTDQQGPACLPLPSIHQSSNAKARRRSSTEDLIAAAPAILSIHVPRNPNPTHAAPLSSSQLEALHYTSLQPEDNPSSTATCMSSSSLEEVFHPFQPLGTPSSGLIAEGDEFRQTGGSAQTSGGLNGALAHSHRKFDASPLSIGRSTGESTRPKSPGSVALQGMTSRHDSFEPSTVLVAVPERGTDCEASCQGRGEREEESMDSKQRRPSYCRRLWKQRSSETGWKWSGSWVKVGRKYEGIRFEFLEIQQDRLEVVRKLGEGAFAVVELCYFSPGPVKIPVAVKRLKPHVMKSNVDLKAMYKEVALLKKLKQSNVVEFIGFGSWDTTDTMTAQTSLFLVEEYVDGGTLKSLVLKDMSNLLDKLPPAYELPDAIRWLIHMARGLDYLHRSQPKVIHRDLKLENILLTDKDLSKARAKIADFGLSAMVTMTEERIPREPAVENRRGRKKRNQAKQEQDWNDAAMRRGSSLTTGTAAKRTDSAPNQAKQEQDWNDAAMRRGSSLTTGTAAKKTDSAPNQAKQEQYWNDAAMRRGSSLTTGTDAKKTENQAKQEQDWTDAAMRRGSSLSVTPEKKSDSPLSPIRPSMLREPYMGDDPSIVRRSLMRRDILPIVSRAIQLSGRTGTLVDMAPIHNTIHSTSPLKDTTTTNNNNNNNNNNNMLAKLLWVMQSSSLDAQAPFHNTDQQHHPFTDTTPKT
eukprot:gene4213-14326_t